MNHVSVSYEIASGVTALLEQAYQPSQGKVVVDSIILDRSVQLFSEKTGIPRLYVEEVSEKYVKPRLDSLRFAIVEVGK